MRARRPSLNEGQRTWVRDWWRALQPPKPESPRPPGELATFNRGTRAWLRRGKGVEALAAQPSAILLARGLMGRGGDRGLLRDEPQGYARVAVVAGVLAYVAHDVEDGKTMGVRLGKAGAGGGPLMSELRFQRILRAASIDDLLVQWRRAVQMADTADVAVFADDMLSWMTEQLTPFPSVSRAHDSVKFHWAHDYYLSSEGGPAVPEQDLVSAEENPA